MDVQLMPVVECIACQRPYVLRVAFDPAQGCWTYAFRSDCKCRQGRPAATGRTATIQVLDRIQAAQAARTAAQDELAKRRNRKGHA